MTLHEWKEIKNDYLSNSQEFIFDYGENKRIYLCWSGNEELPYCVNVCVRKRRHILPDKWATIHTEEYTSQTELLGSFRIDGKTLDEVFDQLD